jgi:hypothetical protein
MNKNQLILSSLLIRNLICIDLNTQNNILVWNIKLKIYFVTQKNKKVA